MYKYNIYIYTINVYPLDIKQLMGIWEAASQLTTVSAFMIFGCEHEKYIKKIPQFFFSIGSMMINHCMECGYLFSDNPKWWMV